MTVEFCRKGYMAPGPGAGTEVKVPGVTPTTPSKLKYTSSRVALALGAKVAVSINPPTIALKSEHFRNFIMLSSDNCYRSGAVLSCSLWPDKTFFQFFCPLRDRFSRPVLSVLFDKARHFLKYFCSAFDSLAPAMAPQARAPHNSVHWHGIFSHGTKIVGQLTRSLPLSRSN